MIVSFATTCMNRRQHLEKTLDANLKVIENLPVEIVILDYSSTDGVSDWLSSRSMSLWGKVRVFRLEGEREWFAAHAKNAAHRLTNPEAEIVCSLDGDNFIAPGLVERLQEVLLNSDRRIVTPPTNDFTGLISMRRPDFFKIGGYDERLRFGYGYEDTDLLCRAKALHFEHVALPRELYANRVKHDGALSVANHPQKDLAVAVAHNAKRMLERPSLIANAGKMIGAGAVIQVV